MKKITYLLACLPITVLAQGNPEMTPEMMKMMEQAQKARACMENIDQSEFDGMEQEGKRMQAEIKSLCTSGKRDEAQKKAIAYSKEMMSRPAMKKIRECSKMLRGMIPKMPFENFEKEYKNRHMCDEL